MFSPTKENLKNIRAASGQLRFGSVLYQTRGIHPDPKFYKYYWYIFTEDSPSVEEGFWDQKNRLSTYEAMNQIRTLRKSGVSAIIYNVRIPRECDLFDVSNEKWTEWAPAFEDDTDQLWNGHK